jgi:hypothetical protein
VQHRGRVVSDVAVTVARGAQSPGRKRGGGVIKRRCGGPEARPDSEAKYKMWRQRLSQGTLASESGDPPLK